MTFIALYDRLYCAGLPVYFVVDRGSVSYINCSCSLEKKNVGKGPGPLCYISKSHLVEALEKL